MRHPFFNGIDFNSDLTKLGIGKLLSGEFKTPKTRSVKCIEEEKVEHDEEED